jgi:DNA-binding MarR family transcriptional regulator
VSRALKAYSNQEAARTTSRIRNGKVVGSILTTSDYRALAELRYQIRLFLHFSEQAVRSVGLNPHQHQLMLALKGLPPNLRPSIQELARRLQIRHHSTVELVNRLTQNGYVRRQRGDEDRREVFILLTGKGERVLNELSLHHQAVLRKAGPALITSLRTVMRTTTKLGQTQFEANEDRRTSKGANR